MQSDSEEKTTNVPDDDPEIIYRIYSVACYFIVLLGIGLPMWWFTTRVYRADLPINRMFDIDTEMQLDKPFGLPLSLEYDILVTVANPDPQNMNFNLDMQDLAVALQSHIGPISPVANFTVKSQFLFLTELGVHVSQVKDHYAIYEDQLPRIITPLEERLWSHMSPRPCINLVLYVTRCGAPVRIYNKQKEVVETNSFISPRWGGITILNPDELSCNSHVYSPKINNLISIFVSQLRKLMGISSLEKVDVLKFKQSKAEDMIDSTKRTLKSLAQLLSEINSIVISDDVAHKIRVAVDSRDEAEKLLKAGDVESALTTAKVAFENSEAAFSDPSLLALLYFPDDQKYAVYIPLFLPVMIPVFMSLTTVRKWYKSKQKVTIKSD